MGWRYRKRIKLFPGVFLNISKSGISINVGTKGANVTLGPKGSYVNTGLPGTGLYRRDKVSGIEKNYKSANESEPKTFNNGNNLYSSNLNSPFSIEGGLINNDESNSSTTAITQTEENVSQLHKEILEPYDPRADLSHYKFPNLSLLIKYDNDGPNIDMAEQNANKDRIVTVLRNFGVEITGIKATIGPTITLYEITPAPGVKISKIRNLSDDLALNISAIGVRIIAPIPGKGTIGIEVPNKNPKIVSMESILNSRRFQETKYDLPIALGKTITNEVFMVDLTKMPHLLVAGATGQGKSVGLNAIITSLLYKKHPAELKLVLMDPYGVEFGIYSEIANHFLASLPGESVIINNSSKAVSTMNCLCKELEFRYGLLNMAYARNIKEYNHKFIDRKLNPNFGHKYLPYIVTVIDEYGDFIEEKGQDLEKSIVKLAQYGSTVGIHLVISTKRPTNDIITETIKANIPTRIAFHLPERIDSQVILDRTGANQLVGRGDMLFLTGSEPVRVQCAFVDTPEVERIVEYISNQQGYPQAFDLPEVEMDDSSAGGGASGADIGSLDSMFEEAARLVVIHQQGSTSLIQRKFSIGFNRAGRLMDQLEKMGIVGPSRGAKPREVLIPDEIALNALLENITL